MRRRSVLAGVGGSFSLGFGGCTSIAGLGDSPAEVSVESVPRLSAHGVEFRVEVVRSGMDGPEPPLVRLELENQRDDPIDRYEWESSLWVGLSNEKKVYLEQAQVAEDGNFEAYIEQMDLPLPSEAGCWLTDHAGSPPWHRAEEGVLDPGETVAKSYIVLGMYENLDGECPEGYYIWELGYPGEAYERLRRGQTPAEDIELAWEFRLKFS